MIRSPRSAVGNGQVTVPLDAASPVLIEVTGADVETWSEIDGDALVQVIEPSSATTATAAAATLIPEPALSQAAAVAGGYCR